MRPEMKLRAEELGIQEAARRHFETRGMWWPLGPPKLRQGIQELRDLALDLELLTFPLRSDRDDPPGLAERLGFVPTYEEMAGGWLRFHNGRNVLALRLWVEVLKRRLKAEAADMGPERATVCEQDLVECEQMLSSLNDKFVCRFQPDLSSMN
jgi:hypothetical protein